MNDSSDDGLCDGDSNLKKGGIRIQIQKLRVRSFLNERIQK